MLYMADLLRDLGVTKPFSGAPKLVEALLVNDMIDVFEANGKLVSNRASSLPRIPRSEGETFEGLLPM